MPHASHPLAGPFELGFGFWPFRLSGVVYGALLNHRAQLDALGQSVHKVPYMAPPKAPVLDLMPRNTLAGHGAEVVVPAGEALLKVGATLGIVIGRAACQVPLATALDFVAGYTIVNALSLPLINHYRPSVRMKARDGFCVIGPQVVPAAQVQAPDKLELSLRLDGVVVQRCSTAGRVRGVARLVSDVTEFMTLQPGDLLLLGAAEPRPKAIAGQRVEVEIDGLGSLSCSLVAEAA